MIAEASGTPNGPFLGVEQPTGKGFCFLAIDVQYVVDGLIKETWHIEDLAVAIQQLTNKDGPDGVPPLHNGQPLNFGMSKQNAAGMQILPSEMPDCMQGFYYMALNHDKDFSASDMKELLSDDYVSHPNSAEVGAAGPGSEGFFGMLESKFWKGTPDLHFEPQAVLRVPCVEGVKYLVISSVTGTTDGQFLGLELKSPRSFHIMAVDIHLVKAGKITESWHVEEWARAIGQLKDEKAVGLPALHNGQPLFAGSGASMAGTGTSVMATAALDAVKRASVTGMAGKTFKQTAGKVGILGAMSSSGSKKKAQPEGQAEAVPVRLSQDPSSAVPVAVPVQEAKSEAGEAKSEAGSVAQESGDEKDEKESVAAASDAAPSDAAASEAVASEAAASSKPAVSDVASSKPVASEAAA